VEIQTKHLGNNSRALSLPQSIRYIGEEKRVYNSKRKSFRETYDNIKIHLKEIVNMWIEFNGLKIGFSSRFLWIRQWTFGEGLHIFYSLQEICGMNVKFACPSIHLTSNIIWRIYIYIYIYIYGGCKLEIQVVIFRDVKLYSLEGRYWRFGGTCCLHHQPTRLHGVTTQKTRIWTIQTCKYQKQRSRICSEYLVLPSFCLNGIKPVNLLTKSDLSEMCSYLSGVLSQAFLIWCKFSQSHEIFVTCLVTAFESLIFLEMIASVKHSGTENFKIKSVLNFILFYM
jgi:hypothetical protein